MKKTYESPTLVDSGFALIETKGISGGPETGAATQLSVTGRVGFYL